MRAMKHGENWNPAQVYKAGVWQAGWLKAGLLGQVCNHIYYAEILNFWKFHETYLLALSQASFPDEIDLNQVNNFFLLIP